MNPYDLAGMRKTAQSRRESSTTGSAEPKHHKDCSITWCGNCDCGVPTPPAPQTETVTLTRGTWDQIKFIASPEGHGPCRSGGIDDEDCVCANTCHCEWARELLALLRSAETQR